MQTLRFVIGLTAASLVGLLLVGGQHVSAQSQGREEITLSPASAKLTVEPGDTHEGSFRVINSGETELDFTVYARPYSVQGEGYEPNYADVTERSGAYRWVQFDRTEGTLAPGSEATIKYTVQVPAGASPGAHHSVLFAETVPDETDEQMVMRTKRVGTVVRLTVEGERDEAGRIESISLPWLQLDRPIGGNIRAENTGNVDLDVESRLVVSTLFGREIHAQSRVNAVFPDQPRLIVQEWEDGPSFGVYKVVLSGEMLGETNQVERYVVAIPTAGLVAIVIVALAGALYVGYRRTR